MRSNSYFYFLKSNVNLTQTSVIPECFVHSSQIYFTLIGMDGRYLAGNPHFLRTYGFSEDTINEKNSLDTIHPDDHDACRAASMECIQNPGKAVSVILRKPVQNKYTFTRWEFLFVPETNEEEPHIQCTGFDISSEIQSNEWVAQYRMASNTGTEIIETLLSNSVDVIFLTDTTGIISFCSPNIKEEMGYDPADLIGKNGFEFVHSEDLSAAIKAFESEIKSPDITHSVDLRFRAKDGTWVWFETKGRNLLQHPVVKGMIVNLNNISLRKKTEEALLESENRYRSFFENLPYPLFLIDPETGRIANCNKSAEEKYGYSIEELQKMNFSDLFEEQPDTLHLNNKYQQQIIVRHRSKSGDLVFAKLEQYNLQSDDNKYQLVITQDVTDNYNRQQESQLAFEISSILMQNAPVDETLTKALQKLRKFAGWDLIELWVPAYDQSFIRNAVSDYYRRHPQADNIKEFIYKTRLRQYTKPVYTSSPAYQSLKPYWIENLEEDDSLVRKNDVLRAGFKSALVIPLLNEGGVVSSIFLFSFNLKKKNPFAEKLIITLGSLIATEIEKNKRENELDQVFKISPDILTIAGLDGRFIKVNPAFEKFIGYNQEEAKGLHPLHYVHIEDRAAVLGQLEQLSNGMPVAYFENRVITKQGDVKWIAWSATPVFEEGMVIATHRDITEQKTIQEKLRLSNERYELATKATANEAIWDLDLTTHEITWSEVFTALFGYSSLKEDATLGFWENHIHPEDRQKVVESFNGFLNQTKTPNWYCEYRFKRIDGSYAFIIDRGYMLFDGENKPVRVVGAMEDNSERKKLEEELVLKERTRQKQIAQAAINAQEKERADVGKELHDNISQMLTSTKLFLDILKNKAPDELLERSLKNINTIIAEIRNISRSLVPSSIEDLGLTASLQDLMDNIRIANIIEVEFYPDSEVETLINENYKLTLYRIVQEQVNNVLKHAGASKLIVELFQDNNKIELVITDNGTGFNPETVKKGHGLKNMRSRAELLNGTMEIISATGKGTKLKIHIPYQ
jgi:PAS domain S-box-containing protein